MTQASRVVIDHLLIHARWRLRRIGWYRSGFAELQIKVLGKGAIAVRKLSDDSVLPPAREAIRKAKATRCDILFTARSEILLMQMRETAEVARDNERM